MMARSPSKSMERCVTNLLDPQSAPQDKFDSKMQAEADEAIINGIVSATSGQSSPQPSPQFSQGAPIKVLTRPVSSGQHPSAGFSFTKARPMPQFDFSRPKKTCIVPQSQDPSPPSRVTPTQTNRHQSPPRKSTAQATQSVISVAAHQSNSPKQHDILVAQNPLPVPFSNAAPAPARTYNYLTRNSTSGPIQLDLSSTRGLANGLSLSADDTMINSNVTGTNGPPMPNTTFTDRNKPATTTLASNYSPAKVVKVFDQPQVNITKRSRKTFKDPLTSVDGAPKITKFRPRRKRLGVATECPPPPSNPKEAYTEDDLLRLLMYRRKQGQQELENSKVSQHQKEAEIQLLRDMSDSLSGQLQEVIERENQKAAELSKLKADKPVLEEKIKNLSKYARGLTNDNERLREDAEDLQKQHKDVCDARKELHITLEEVQNSAEQERIRSQRFEDDARHKIETLAQTVEHQSSQLRSDGTLLVAEQERNSRLEDQISRITASHGQLVELFTGHRDAIAGKIDDLLHQTQPTVPPNQASSFEFHDSIRPVLEQCVELLQKLHKADTVKPEDLRKINDTMDIFVEGYVPFV